MCLNRTAPLGIKPLTQFTWPIKPNDPLDHTRKAQSWKIHSWRKQQNRCSVECQTFSVKCLSGIFHEALLKDNTNHI